MGFNGWWCLDISFYRLFLLGMICKIEPRRDTCGGVGRECLERREDAHG